MKLINIILFAGLLLSQNFAHAEGDMNFRFGPIGLLIGALTPSLDVAINEEWTVGGGLLMWKMELSEEDYLDNTEISLFGVEARANWFSNGVFKDGLYVGPSVGWARAKVETTDTLSGDNLSAKASAAFVSAVVGYAWFWQSFNQMLGAGISTGLDNKIEVTDSRGNVTEVNTPNSSFAFEYTVGWTF